MRMVRGFVLGLAALAMIGFIATPSEASEKPSVNPATVGDFLVSYAKALRIELPATASPEVVVASLKAVGVKLDGNIDTSKPLTQADVVRIGKANGLRITTRNPQAAFSAIEIDQFFTVYGLTLMPRSIDGTDTRFAAGHPNPGTNPDTGRQGLKKGHQSPHEPD